MNNKNKELMNNDVDINVSEEYIILAPPVELFDEAREIAQSTASDKKFPFYLHYDPNQKEFLLSLLNTAGAIVESDDEESHILSTSMKMTQLAFVKRLDCVERVSTDEDEESIKATVATANARAIAQAVEDESTVSEYAVDTASVESTCDPCPCPDNSCIETAREIAEYDRVDGNISCPGSEQWFKFTASKTGTYTIFTKGSLDTIGTLYDSNYSYIAESDDCDSCGDLNFRIYHDLVAGETYFIRVRAYYYNTGNYILKVCNSTAVDYVSITPATIELKSGKTYELPSAANGGPISGINNAEVNVIPHTADKKGIRWSSSDDSIMTVSPINGDGCYTLTTLKDGSAKLYAYDDNDDGKRGECTVIISNDPPPNWIPIKVKCANGLTVMSEAVNGSVLGVFTNDSDILLIDETPQNEVMFHVYGTLSNGITTDGWCSGEYLEQEVNFLRCLYDYNNECIRVRNAPTATESNGNGKIVGKISNGAEVELLDTSVESQDIHSWYKIIYNRMEAYVVADDAEYDYEIIKKSVLLARNEIKKRIYAATVYAEAAGQNRRSKQAVAHVMNNRIGTTGTRVDIEAVVSEPYQFDGYGNRMYQDAMSYYSTGNWNNSIERAAMDECINVITPIYNGEEVDITDGALYFHSFTQAEDWEYHEEYTLITVNGTEGFWFYK